MSILVCLCVSECIGGGGGMCVCLRYFYVTSRWWVTGDRWQEWSFSMFLTGGRGVLIVIGTEGPQLREQPPSQLCGRGHIGN